MHWTVTTLLSAHETKHAGQAGGESLRQAVDLVTKEQDPALTQQLTQYLEGQQPGAPSDAALAMASSDSSAKSTYLVLLYMALGRHEEAAEVAVGLARRAQEAGNYKVCMPIRGEFLHLRTPHSFCMHLCQNHFPVPHSKVDEESGELIAVRC